ncbi:MAG: flagellar motor protein MotB [Polyangiales bacterium]
MTPRRQRSMSSFGAVAMASGAMMFASSGLTGCVTQGTYDRAMAAAATSVRQRDDRIARIESGLAEAKMQIELRERKIAELDAARSNAVHALDEATAIDQHLREELTRLGRDVDKVLAEKGTMSKALDDARARLAELRAAQEAAARRTRTFAELASALRPRIDDGSLTVVLRHGRVVVTIVGDLLFEPGKTELRPTAKALIAEVAKSVHDLGDRSVEVGAHADEALAGAAKATRDDRWTFTTARAVAVVVALADSGLPAARLSATGFGTHDPVADNDTPEGRARNRRVEIALRPDLAEDAARPSMSAAAVSIEPSRSSATRELGAPAM